MTKDVELRTLSLLFADTHGFSKLTGFQISIYVTTVLPIVATILDTHKPVASNTWGDGLFAAFHDASAAADCALELRDKFLDGHWENKGLPNELAVRISLHIGAVWVGDDPIRRELALFGREVNRTARIEPIVEPTQIYATEAFQAMLTGDNHFAFDPLGMRDLAKSWGTQKLFALRRCRDPAIKAPPPPTAEPAMTIAAEASKRHPDKIQPLVKFIHAQNFSSHIVWRDWRITLSYDISKLNEGTITEQMEWDYKLFNHSSAPVSYPVKLFEFGDVASDLGDKRSFTVQIGDDREEVLDTQARSRTKVLTRHEREVEIPPGDSASCTLIYPQPWKVNPQAPVIHNCLTPRDPVLGCTIDVQLPDGYSIGLFVNARELSPEPARFSKVYKIRLLAACQAIEYMLLRDADTKL